MGAGKRIRQIIKDKKMKFKDFAGMYNPGSKSENKAQVVSNMITRDNMTFATVEEMAEVLNCEIIFRDKETGKEY